MARPKDWNQILQESHDNFSSAYDFSGTQLIYLGKYRLAQRTTNTPKSEPIWQIKKFSYDGSGNISDIQFPNGDDDFQSVWDTRASNTYF